MSDPEYDDEYYEDGDDAVSEGGMEGMDPDHPLLARAQAALKKQLLDTRLDLDEKIREKNEELNKEKTKREQIGVELYTVQQQLAKLQMTLEKTHDNYNVVTKIREQAESDLNQLQEWYESKAVETNEQRLGVDRYQLELDKLNGTLKQIEQYNEQMKSEIAVTRRATYVAEESVSKLEKEKQDQDLLIDTLQETLKQLHQSLALYETMGPLYEAQMTAQQKETKAARETLAEAGQEMEAINFEKKQLLQQWKSSLIGMAKRDEALQATEQALHKQREQVMSIESETEGYKRSIKEEEHRNEQLTQVLRKVETEAEFLQKNIVTCREKKEKLIDAHAKLKKSLEQTEEHADMAVKEAKSLDSEALEVEKEIVKTNQETRDHDEDMLVSLSEQTTVEKGVHKTIDATRKVRKQIRTEEVNVTNFQNEIAKVRVDVLNTQAHNGKLQETLDALEAELKEKSRTIEKYESEIKRRNDEIEKKTKDVDRLNREFEKKTAGIEDENTGPLEATIKNMNREIEIKARESKDLQRRWVGFQTELVALVNENNNMTEKVQRLKAEKTILGQRRVRLNQNFERQREEIKELDKAVDNMHKDMTRINTLIAKNTNIQEALSTDNFVLETEIVGELKELEVEAVRLESRIEQSAEEKRQVLAEVVEAERQIMLWERKIQLEKETQAALDPDVGNDVVTAMKKEIHRMEYRHAELMRRQEKLIQEMEKSIYKRELIQTKSQIASQQSKGAPKKGSAKQELTQQGLKKACGDLKRSIRETDKEAADSEARIQQLEEERARAGDEIEATAAAVHELRSREEELRAAQQGVDRERERLALEAAKATRMLRRFEDLSAGRYQTTLSEEELFTELDKASHRREKLAAAVEDICDTSPHLEPALDRALTLLSI